MVTPSWTRAAAAARFSSLIRLSAPRSSSGPQPAPVGDLVEDRLQLVRGGGLGGDGDGAPPRVAAPVGRRAARSRGPPRAWWRLAAARSADYGAGASRPPRTARRAAAQAASSRRSASGGRTPVDCGGGGSSPAVPESGGSGAASQNCRPSASRSCSRTGPQICGYASGQLVTPEAQPCQIGEATKLARYLPAQLVVIEFQLLKIGEAAEFAGYLPGQLIAIKEEQCQVLEVAKLARYLPGQPVTIDVNRQELCTSKWRDRQEL